MDRGASTFGGVLRFDQGGSEGGYVRLLFADLAVLDLAGKGKWHILCSFARAVCLYSSFASCTQEEV